MNDPLLGNYRVGIPPKLVDGWPKAVLLAPKVDVAVLAPAVDPNRLPEAVEVVVPNNPAIIGLRLEELVCTYLDTYLKCFSNKIIC